ncbi:hypothetical protein BK004_04845 [bacterium CG10_46_32]|nr:MAG: hypothetical protein BK004_04845 [bacterium CG10_46_32]PIR55700.1 MAG: hypothetical protein COU73_04890 [Parcubacteria group bacterium CG10_big_fil_rev_8_21_14_0_10_46_32]
MYNKIKQILKTSILGAIVGVLIGAVLTYLESKSEVGTTFIPFLGSPRNLKGLLIFNGIVIVPIFLILGTILGTIYGFFSNTALWKKIGSIFFIVSLIALLSFLFIAFKALNLSNVIIIGSVFAAIFISATTGAVMALITYIIKER